MHWKHCEVAQCSTSSNRARAGRSTSSCGRTVHSAWPSSPAESRLELQAVDIYIASAEDTILAKLEWGKTSNSDRQFKDALAIAMTQEVDRQYLAKWADELDVVDLLNAMLNEADSFGSDEG